MAGRTTRPRVEGAREQEILAAALDLLAETGYDRLTFDALAAHTRSSKATLYRRWASKAALLAEAVETMAPLPITLPDTGSLRGDLLALAGAGGFFEPAQARLVGGLATALYREPEVHEAVRRILLEAGTTHLRALLTRAVERGQVRGDLDVELVCGVVPAMALYDLLFRTPGELAPQLVPSVIEQVVLPAVESHERRADGAVDDQED